MAVRKTRKVAPKRRKAAPKRGATAKAWSNYQKRLLKELSGINSGLTRVRNYLKKLK